MNTRQIAVALCALAASQFAFANTVAVDNVNWSTTRVADSGPAPECTAYSMRRIVPGKPELKDIALEMLAITTASIVNSKGGYSDGTMPNRCRSGF